MACTFLPDYIADAIGTIIYNADCEARDQLINGIIGANERSYMGGIASLAARDLKKEVNFREFNFYLNPRDIHARDVAFVFRLGNEVKVAFCEAKLLRFFDEFTGQPYPLHTKWDAPQEGECRFSRQIEVSAGVSKSVVFFFLFATQLKQGQFSLPLDSLGSTCIGKEGMQKVYEKLKKGDIGCSWSLQDLIALKQFQPYVSNLEDIISDLLKCKSGEIFNVIGSEAVFGKGKNALKIPIPKANLMDTKQSEISEEDAAPLKQFLEENSLDGLQYYEIDRLQVQRDVVLKRLEAYKKKLNRR